VIAGLAPRAAHAQSCPAAIPKPANQLDVNCFTIFRPPAKRCPTKVPFSTCANVTDQAFAEALLTSDGAADLKLFHFCPVIANTGGGDQISDFCPSACPVAIPRPADFFAVDCFTINTPAVDRCATPIAPTACDALNTKALGHGLITQDGLEDLDIFGFCAVAADFGTGPQLIEFCPRG
jgi:hypothetical protein